MCGIISCIGGEGVFEPTLAGLANLEYRGYDSAGVAVQREGGLSVFKCEGTVDDLQSTLGRDVSGTRAIGHTRWSTHGPPSDANAHPHTDCTGRVAVVHNGIIDNYESLRADLVARGHEFTSDTDTEVVPHLVEEALAAGADPKTAFDRAVARLEGSYALVVLVDGHDALYATRRGSPLVLGVDGDRHFLASDVPAFLDHTDSVVYLEDGDVVTVEDGRYEVEDEAGDPVVRTAETVDWVADDVEKGAYDHFMYKEINEQPSSLSQAVWGRCTPDGEVDLDGIDPGQFAAVDRVHLVAAGTSYHASLEGQYLLSSVGVPAQAHLASEFATSPPPLDGDSLVVGVSQSGETADTLEALRAADRLGARTLVVTNTVGSTAGCEADDTVLIRAGPEIGVAATKTFSSQVVTLVLLAECIARDVTGEGHEEFPAIAEALQRLPDDVQRVLDTTTARSLARRFSDSLATFFIGRGLAYPIALEGALKFKEITYEHAEGFAAGELKHGTLALVTADTPVFAVFTEQDDEKTLGNVREVQARDAPVVAVAAESNAAALNAADAALTFPDTHPVVAPVLANVQLQLVSYHVADLLSRPIDKPRNLAKSVTVE